MLVTERMTPLRVHGRVVHQIGLPYHWGPNGLLARRRRQRADVGVVDPNVHIQEVKAFARDIRPGRRRAARRCLRFVAELPAPRRRDSSATGRRSGREHAERRPPGPRRRAGWREPPGSGFFTDTSVCIGCKACEVACKEWNAIPDDGLDLTGMSYDNTVGLGADSWRHVAFIEQNEPIGHQEAGLQRARAQVVDLGMPAADAGSDRGGAGPDSAG